MAGHMLPPGDNEKLQSTHGCHFLFYPPFLSFSFFILEESRGEGAADGACPFPTRTRPDTHNISFSARTAVSFKSNHLNFNSSKLELASGT